MELSKRLQAVADLVTSGLCVADIGTDHGYIPIYLVQSGRIPCAIAMDINKGPLERARKHICECHLEPYIQTRLSDGLSALQKHEVESVVIAGMGGGLIMKILSHQNKNMSDVKEFILQPQSDLLKVRSFLQQHNYLIICEDMVLEDGKFYSMLKVKKVESCPKIPSDFIYSPYLLEHRHPVLKLYLYQEMNKKNEILQLLKEQSGEHIINRILKLKEEVAYAEQILYRYYEDNRI
ncbi:MAG: class I SAM-dependent methyltransferase [Lachnospiraceae bacterium]